MNGRNLLDTNIVIALFAKDPAVLRHLEEAGEIFVPSMVLGELYFGAGKSGRVGQNLALIDEFALANVVLACDAETARYYGEVKRTLQSKGRPIPENDIWISAIALQHDLTLITRDAHFEAVENLKRERW